VRSKIVVALWVKVRSRLVVVLWVKVRSKIVVALWVKVRSRLVVALKVKVPSSLVVVASGCDEAQFKTGTCCTRLGSRKITDADVGSVTLRNLFDNGKS
jgi:hypothetical protein